MVSSNYSETLSEYDLSGEPEADSPRRVLWCGSNSVVLAWDSTILMVGPFGHTLRYYYVEPVHLITEVDGLRVISIDRCELLQKVPGPSLQTIYKGQRLTQLDAASTVAIFQPGSIHAGSMLLEAHTCFVNRNAGSHELISNIKPDLMEAVDVLIEAAGREIDPNFQRRLLKAASFGKTFLESYNPADFVAMSDRLRVLNAVRHYTTGIAVTYDQ